MVDEQEELLKFVKQNLKLILSLDFSEKMFKENKKQYFSVHLKNKFIPKDREIANATLNYLIKIKNIAKDCM